MSTSDHTEYDGQTERAKRVLDDIFRGYVHSFLSWIEFLPMVEFQHQLLRACFHDTHTVLREWLTPPT